MALSGGVFQNAALLAGLTAAPRRRRLRGATATALVPANDGGHCAGAGGDSGRRN
ncbi:MAG: hypothetical protein MZV70_06765 [Desulfobacterales bacterium]|nr:hypothetical protein [Desulfobacterales bacterium]